MDKSVYNNIIAGGIAGVSNVYLTYPLRTVVKIQYVEGLTIIDSIKKLYNQNKLIRFYDGVKPTLFRVGFGRCLEAGSYSYFNNNTYKISHSGRVRFTVTHDQDGHPFVAGL